ncbi:MAG: hypothetical protein ACTJLK_02070, partial [Anaplasma sp.]
MKKETKKPKSKMYEDTTPLLSEDLSYIENEGNFFSDIAKDNKKDSLISKVRKKLTTSPRVTSSGSSYKRFENDGESRDTGSQSATTRLRKAVKSLSTRVASRKRAPSEGERQSGTSLEYGFPDGSSYTRLESRDYDILHTDDPRMNVASMKSFASPVEDVDPESVFGAPSNPNEVWTASFDTDTTSRNPYEGLDANPNWAQQTATQESASSTKATASEPIYAVSNKVRTGRAPAREDTPPVPPKSSSIRTSAAATATVRPLRAATASPLPRATGTPPLPPKAPTTAAPKRDASPLPRPNTPTPASQESAKTGVARPSSPPPAPPRT